MRRAYALALLLALLAAACGGTPPSGAADASNAAASSTTAGAASGQPSGATASGEASTPPANASASGQPGAGSEAPSASGAPSDVPTPTPPVSSDAAGLLCNPEGTNPTFWSTTARSVTWDVYCAVLPKGWIVSSGQFWLAKGGWLTISYKGPAGETLTLSEGSFCKDGTGCVPSGTEDGDASFGALAGTLVATDAGGFAIVVARGQQPSWLMVSGGLDRPTTLDLGAALAKVSS